MVAKDVRFSAGARAKMLRGINILADAVKVTLGPRGRNVLVGRPFGAPRITKDGVSVAREIELADHFENMGAQMVREVATKTSSEAGDGTTTATILAQAILCEGEKAVAAGMNSIDLKRGIDLAVGAVVAALRTASRPVTTNDEIAQVATISANGEREVGDILARAMNAVGRDGVITVEEAKGMATELDVVEGLTFDRGYISPYFVTDAGKMEAVLDDAFVLLCDRKLGNLQPLLPLLEAIVRSDKPLLVVAEDVEGEALATLVVNRLRGGLRVVAVKAPGFGERRKAMLDDIAAVTGGQVVSEELGTTLETVTIDALGRARQIRVDRDATTIIDGAGDRSAIEERCAQIRRQIAETTSDHERDTLQERLGKLVGGVAVIRVGGATETEVKERKDRVEDAMHATRAAVEEGILPGGGSALLFAAPSLTALRPENEEQRVGIDIVRRALQAPLRQIAANAGVDGSVVVGRLLDRGDPNRGYDAQGDAYGDMFALGIVDPTKVVRIALQDAASIAGLMITTEAMVADRPAGDDAAAEPAGEMAY